MGIPFAMPSRHSFNPLPYLRLAMAYDGTPEVVDPLFRAVWVSGGDPTDPVHRERLDAELAAAHGARDPTSPETKQALRDKTDAAAALGVFGVPTAIVSSEGRADALLWGLESLDMLHALIANPNPTRRI